MQEKPLKIAESHEFYTNSYVYSPDSLGRVLQGVEMVCLVGFSTHFTTKVVHNGILEGFQISKFDEGFRRGVFGLVDISGELRVDSLGRVLQGVEMVCLVGFPHTLPQKWFTMGF